MSTFPIRILGPLRPPQGMQTSMVDLVLWNRVHTKIKNPKSKAQDLQDIRDRAAPAPIIPPKTMEQYIEHLNGSEDALRAFTEAVEDNAAAIEKGKARLESVGTPPPKPKVLQRMVSGIKSGAKLVFNDVILSRPVENERDSSKLNVPTSRSDTKRSTLDKLLHRPNYGSAADLLGAGHLRSRELAPSLKTSEFVLNQAEEDVDVAEALLAHEGRTRLLKVDATGRTVVDNLIDATRNRIELLGRQAELRRAQVQVDHAGGPAAAQQADLNALEDARRAIVAVPPPGLAYDKAVAQQLKANFSELNGYLGGRLGEEDVQRLIRIVNDSTSPDTLIPAALDRMSRAQAAIETHDAEVRRLDSIPGPANPPWRAVKDAERVNLAQDLEAAQAAYLQIQDDILNNQRTNPDPEYVIRRIFDEIDTPVAFDHDALDLLNLRNKARQNRHQAENFKLAATTAMDAARGTAVAEGQAPLNAKIGRLDGFDPDADPLMVRNPIINKLGLLRNKFAAQSTTPTATSGLATDALDGAAAFQTFYRTLQQTFSSPGQLADTTRANNALDILQGVWQPGDRLADLLGRLNDLQTTPPPDLNQAAISDALRLLQELAQLGRGTEIIQRMLIPDGVRIESQSRGLTDSEVALRVYLLAGKHITDEAATITANRMQLFNTAREAALELARRPAGGARRTTVSELDGTQRIAFLTVRNGLVARQDLDSAAQRLQKLRDQWVPRGAERQSGWRRVFGRVGQGDRFPKNLLPHTGKTPFSNTTFSRVDEVSTRFSLSPARTGERINDYVMGSATQLSMVVLSVGAAMDPARPLDDMLMLRMLASDAARHKCTEADPPVRPEQVEMTRGEIIDMIDQFRYTPPNDPNDAAFIADLDRLKGMVTDPPAEPFLHPLKAEHVIQWRDEVRNAVNGLPALDTVANPNPTADAARVARNAAITAAHNALETASGTYLRLEGLLNTDPTPTLQTPEDIYRELRTAIMQIDVRGKQRMTSGGIIGGNLKPLTLPLKVLDMVSVGTGGIVPTVKVQLQLQHGRTAVFEMAMSTVGFELTIAVEDRNLISTGVSAGLGIGTSVVKGTPTADKSISKESVKQKGIKIVIPRCPKKKGTEGHYSDEVVRLEALELLDQTLQFRTDANGAIIPLNPVNANGSAALPEVPANLAAIMDHCPHASIAVSDDISDTYSRAESGFGVQMKEGSPFGGGSGAFSHVGGARNSRLKYRLFQTSDRTGTNRINRRNRQEGGATSGSAGPLGPSIGVNPAGMSPAGLSFGTAFFSIATQYLIFGKDLKYRHVMIDGKTDATYTQFDTEHANAQTLIDSIEANIDAWVEFLMQDIFKTKNYKKYADRPMAEKRQIVMDQIHQGFEIMRQMELTDDGQRIIRNVFAEGCRLEDSAAAQLDYLGDQITQCQLDLARFQHQYEDLRQNHRPRSETGPVKEQINLAKREFERLRAAQIALIRQPDSWSLWKFTGNERTLDSLRAGFDFFLTLMGFDLADGQRAIFRIADK